MKIAPTHTCFNDVLDYLSALGDERIFQFKVLHGILRSEDAGDYSHAWLRSVEKGDAIDFGIVSEVNDVSRNLTKVGDRIEMAFDWNQYLTKRQVLEYTEYEIQEVWESNKISGMFGPWKKRYLLACNDIKSPDDLPEFILDPIMSEKLESFGTDIRLVRSIGG